MENKITELLNRVPGYTGYRSKEDRRDDDKRLRESISASLDSTVATLTSTSAKVGDQRRLTHISTLERLVGSTRHLADRVRSASYGYGGIFSDQSVDELALDQLRQFDNAFQKESEELAALAGRLEASPEGPLDVDITAYQTELNRLGLLFDARGDVVASALPNKDAAVLALLDPAERREPSALSALRVGDALSIQGENYVVNATLTFTEPDRQVTLSRIGHDDDGNPIWLIGSNTEDVTSAKLVETESDPASTPSGRTARAVIVTGPETREGVPAQYAYTATTGSEVSFSYSVGGEARAFTGSTIEEEDVEVYGQA